MTMGRTEAERFEHEHERRPTLPERGITTSSRNGVGNADWANTQQFASIKQSEDDWVRFFDQRPDVLHQLLGDLYIVDHYDQKKRDTGKRLDGRRVMPTDANLDQLWSLLSPRYSMHPFELAVKELIGERSLRQFAARVPMDHRELSRMMRGQSKPSTYWLERIASSAQVSPSYFLEWRIEFVTTRLARLFMARPNLSVQVAKRLQAAPALR